MKKILIAIVFTGILFTSVQANEVDNAVARAVTYLNGQGNEATKTMALAAAGQSVDVSYLKSFSGFSAIEYAKPIMAIASARENPSTYPNEDFVSKLKSFTTGAQLGDASQVNDDIWGILALRASGLAAGDPVIQNSKAFILANQNTDGGWAWNVGGTSDTNDTAGAIMALLETGMTKSDTAIQNAISYIKAAQNNDGGFSYDPVSEFGTPSTGSGQAASDANSDAWVMMAFHKLGEDTSSIASHLLSLQDTDGGFWWMQPPADFNNKAATADAVIALTGNSFPVRTSNGENGGGNPQNTQVFYRIVGSAGDVCRGVVEAVNAMDVVVHAASECGYTYDIQDTSLGLYVVAINSDRAEGLKGWMYAVSGEIPEIGAADYTLSGGEDVVWFFGEVGDEAPLLGDVSDTVDLFVDIVNTGGGDGGGGNNSEVGFSVSSSFVDFGQLLPGSSGKDLITLKNEGQKNITVAVEVEGDSVFTFLNLNEILWNLFTMVLPVGMQEDVDIELSVPAGFQSFGKKQGTLIFWGQSK